MTVVFSSDHQDSDVGVGAVAAAGEQNSIFAAPAELVGREFQEASIIRQFLDLDCSPSSSHAVLACGWVDFVNLQHFHRSTRRSPVSSQTHHPSCIHFSTAFCIIYLFQYDVQVEQWNEIVVTSTRVVVVNWDFVGFPRMKTGNDDPIKWRDFCSLFQCFTYVHIIRVPYVLQSCCDTSAIWHTGISDCYNITTTSRVPVVLITNDK